MKSLKRRSSSKTRGREEKNIKGVELPGKYTAKLLYMWDDQRFEEEYLNKLEKIGKDGKKIERLTKANI